MAACETRISVGVEGFEPLVDGGLYERDSYLVRGAPGTGKTTFGLHFLAEGVDQDEDVLYINLGEEASTIERVASNFGFPFNDIDILDLSPSGEDFVEEEGYDIFSSAEVERQPITDEIAEAVTDSEPTRVFVDPVTQLRYLTPDDFQFRKQILSLLRFLSDHGATVLFTSQSTSDEPDDDLQFLSDGVITLHRDGEQRSIEVAKLRGSDFVGGEHSMTISDDGITVYPRLRLRQREHDIDTDTPQLSSGIPELDQMLGGGIEKGTITFISGPSGVGKSTLGTAFMKEAAGRGERSTLYLFEESVQTLVHRSKSVNIPIEEMRERGTLEVKPMESLAMDTHQFAAQVKADVEEHDTDIVMIDGLEGYQLAVHQDDLLQPMHRLVRYLSEQGVTTLLLAETKQITGAFQVTDHGGTYLADNLVFLQHVELNGEMRKVIGVLKKRMSDYERTLREFQITEDGVRVGEPMTALRGILTGTPEIVTEGGTAQLIDDD